MSSKTIILFSLMTILSLPLGEAATITVGPEGCDHVGIQAAIDAASPGDVVSVQNGTYRENLVVDKPIVLRNSGDGTDRPIVDAGGRGSAVTLVADGKFHTVELGPFTAGKELGLYLAISRDGSMPEVYFDCMWLRQEK